MFLKKYLAVAVGGVIGTLLRYLAYSLLDANEATFPWATVTVNLIGSFLLAFVAASINSGKLQSKTLQAGVSGGLLASFTTFSNLGLDIVVLLNQAAFGTIVLYLLVSLAGGGLFALAGWHLVKSPETNAESP